MKIRPNIRFKTVLFIFPVLQFFAFLVLWLTIYSVLCNQLMVPAQFDQPTFYEYLVEAGQNTQRESDNLAPHINF